MGAISQYAMKPRPRSSTSSQGSPGHRGLRTYRIVEGLWEASKRYPGFLNLPRPLGYVEDFGLLLEERSALGAPFTATAWAPTSCSTGVAAAEALRVIHRVRCAVRRADLYHNRDRALDRVAEQFTLRPADRALPAHGPHRAQCAITVRRTDEEDVLPTHGDMKYDESCPQR